MPERDTELNVALLGPFAVSRHGQPLGMGGAKLRTLLTMLALADGEVVALDEIVEQLWGSGGATHGAAALHTLVSRLRRVLGEAATIRAEGTGYRLEGVAVDVARFDRLSAQARATEDEDDLARLLTDALDLWRGHALADFADLPFARAEAARLTEARAAATEALADVRLAQGRAPDAVALMERLVAAEPFRESAWRRLMLALYRAGRQADALAAYRTVRDRLAEDLGLEPGPELRRLEAAILGHSPDLAPPVRDHLEPPKAEPASEPRPHNLPTFTSRFVGRAAEVAHVVALLQSERLVTLWGPGGVGKTRLSLEIAARTVDSYRDGVCFVELAPVADAASVAPAVITALGMLPASGADLLAEVVRYLRPRQALLVLDNCEPVLDGAATLTHAVLAGCPDVRVVTSSREPLAIPGECVWSAPSLSLPPARAGLAELAGCDAVELFFDRVSLAFPGFALTEANAEAVADICRRLDGIPLALELAAPRVRTLGVAGIAERLDDRFRLLTGGARTADVRHQTLRAAVDWSHDLLTPDEQNLLGALSVFPAGFDLLAAEAVAPRAERDRPVGFEVLDLLARLVERSLVVAVDTENGVRYRLLETIRQYAAERMPAGQIEAARGRHLEHFVALPGGDLTARFSWADAWWQQIERDYDNSTGALDYATSLRDVAMASRLVARLFMYWVWTEDPGARVRTERVLALGEPPVEVAGVLSVLAGCWWTDDPRWTSRTAISMTRELDDPEMLALIHVLFGHGEVTPDPAEVREFTRVGLELARGLDLPTATAAAWQASAWQALMDGNLTAARDCAQQGLDTLPDRHRDGVWVSQLTTTLAVMSALSGEVEPSSALVAQAAQCLQRQQLPALGMVISTRAAAVSALNGQWVLARAYLEELLPVLRRLGTHRFAGDALEFTALVLEAEGRRPAASRVLCLANAHRRRFGEVRGGSIPPYADLVDACEQRLADVGLPELPSPDDLDAVVAGAIDALAEN